MLFLSWIFSGDVGTAFLGMLRIACMSIIANIYNLISTFYNIFFYITKVTILSGAEDSFILGIYNRIQIFLAVIMIFYVTFEFVKYIVNPDTFEDKEKGGVGLLKRILIVIVLMAFTPQIFGIAYNLQSRIINSDIIPKILINDYSDAKHDGLMSNGGKFSSDLLSLFYKPFKGDNGQPPSGNCDDGRTADQVVETNLNKLAENGKMVNATYCIANAGGDVIENGEKHNHPYLISMGFGGLLPIVVGCFMIWVLLNYCAEAGRVVIQFVFLQIIAPIPILSYLAPGKDGMFNKWVRQCVTTYLDLFIRLFIIYLVMMISQMLLQSGVTGVQFFAEFDKLAWDIQLWIKLFIFIGLCLFAMKAPKMVKELLPGGENAASGDFGLKARELPKPVVGAAGAALGAGWGVASRGYKQWRASRAKNKEIKDELRKNGMATDRGAVRQARKNARSEEKEARRALNGARKAYDAASKENRVTGGKVDDETIKAYNSARENYVKFAENKAKHDALRTRNSAISGLAGATYGFVNGAISGASTTKITELHKTFSNVNKSVNEKITTREKWVDAGAMNIFERTKARILASSPTLTESQLVKKTLDDMKKEAESYDRVASQGMQVKSAIDDVGKRTETKLDEGVTFSIGEPTLQRVLNGIESDEERGIIREYLGKVERVGGEVEVGRLYKQLSEEVENKHAEVAALATALADPKNAADEPMLRRKKIAAEKASLDAQRILGILKPKMTEVLGFELIAGLYDGQKMADSSVSKEIADVFARLRDARNDKTIELIREKLPSTLADLFEKGDYEAVRASLSTDAQKVVFGQNIERILKELKTMSGEYQRNAASINSIVNSYSSGYASSVASALNDVTGSGKKG